MLRMAKTRPSKQPLSARQDLYAQLITFGATVGEASEKAGISPTQGYRWRKASPIKGRIEQLRSQAFDAAIGGLTKVLQSAVRSLEEIATNPNELAVPRVTAAQSIVALLCKIRSDIELENRIRKLESFWQKAHEDQS